MRFFLCNQDTPQSTMASQLHMQRTHAQQLNVLVLNVQVRMLIASDQAALERFNSSLAESYVEVITQFSGPLHCSSDMRSIPSHGMHEIVIGMFCHKLMHPRH